MKWDAIIYDGHIVKSRVHNGVRLFRLPDVARAMGYINPGSFRGYFQANGTSAVCLPRAESSLCVSQGLLRQNTAHLKKAGCSPFLEHLAQLYPEYTQEALAPAQPAVNLSSLGLNEALDPYRLEQVIEGMQYALDFLKRIKSPLA